MRDKELPDDPLPEPIVADLSRVAVLAAVSVLSPRDVALLVPRCLHRVESDVVLGTEVGEVPVGKIPPFDLSNVQTKEKQSEKRIYEDKHENASQVRLLTSQARRKKDIKPVVERTVGDCRYR